MRLESAVPLAPLTTLRLGGPASRLAEVTREADVEEAVREADRAGEPLFVLGGGSNVVVADAGFAGVVARMAVRGLDVESQGDRVHVRVGAGEAWDPFVALAVERGWEGIACMSGIPGLVGATPIQNVGAYGQEVRETIVGVRAFDRSRAEWVDLDGADCRFAYRTSVFKRTDRWIVTAVRFSFAAGSSGDIVRYGELARALGVAAGERAPAARVRDTVVALRRAKGMVLDPEDADSVSVGSFFVNPVVDGDRLAAIEERAKAAPPNLDVGGGGHRVAAAWLVERAGFARGWGAGRAGLSRKHALALVNRGGASARDVLEAARAIQAGVFDRFGVRLEPEPVLVGCSWEEGGL